MFHFYTLWEGSVFYTPWEGGVETNSWVKYAEYASALRETFQLGIALVILLYFTQMHTPAQMFYREFLKCSKLLFLRIPTIFWFCNNLYLLLTKPEACYLTRNPPTYRNFPIRSVLFCFRLPMDDCFCSQLFEPVLRKCSTNRLFWKFLQNLQENTWNRVRSYKNRRTPLQIFPCEFY